ncbi:uncharacterized protein LOC135429333 [Drosophila montana]|uniref:uncharacterized protein LOC135429333 n=1 Tax=Drosophila montana TaxID=40370 RepID=UPI00313CE2CC
MCDVQQLLCDLGQTFNKFKELRRTELLKVLGQVRCCECGHRIRMLRARQQAGKWPSRTLRLLTACFILMLALLICWLHLARRFNHAQSHGTGGCPHTLFYTYTDCDVYV